MKLLISWLLKSSVSKYSLLSRGHYVMDTLRASLISMRTLKNFVMCHAMTRAIDDFKEQNFVFFPPLPFKVGKVNWEQFDSCVKYGLGYAVNDECSMWGMYVKQCIKYCPECKVASLYELVAAEDVEVEEQDGNTYLECRFWSQCSCQLLKKFL
ncbi:hypothetical protein FRX31_022402 [Thalictrum thalictroides]|uniref:Uncharacterized protein n=1 Tax=Thalictrum thalictroides TaxID=46969 RepID=A0A7J6VSD9_THATH|nr:hypothetical protein FRX31_022402 [Thalictrum thalictroides]